MLPGNDASNARQRLFIAIRCPLVPSIQAALDELGAAQRMKDSGLRVVDAATLHLTVKFLGATAASQLPAIHEVMAQQARLQPAFAVDLVGVGSFRGVLWLGVAPNPVLTELAQRISTALEPLGFAADAKPFLPHLTVARISPTPRFDSKGWLEQHRQAAWGSVPVDALHLYRSDTYPDGARYSIVHTSLFN